VTNLASQRAVVGGALDLAFLVVALQARQRARVPDGLALDGGDCVGSIMPDFAKRLGHESIPDHDHRHYGEDQEDPQADDLIRKLPDSQIIAHTEQVGSSRALPGFRNSGLYRSILASGAYRNHIPRGSSGVSVR